MIRCEFNTRTRTNKCEEVRAKFENNNKPVEHKMADVSKKMQEMLDRFATEMKAEISKSVRKLEKSLIKEIELTKKEVKECKEEVTELKKELHENQEEWKKKEEKLENKVNELEKAIEKRDREARKYNVIISGLQIQASDKNTMVQVANEQIKKLWNVNLVVTDVWQINDEITGVKLARWEDKLVLFKAANKIKNKEIFVNSDLTLKEREIQRELRSIKKQEIEKGNKAAVGYQKIFINNTEYRWDPQGKKLINMTENIEDPKN